MGSVTHVTHEALRKVGGIGAVLEGLLGADAYRREVRRTFLAGPTTDPADAARLADVGELLYDTRTGSGAAAIRAKLDPIAQKFDVNLLYGNRKLSAGGVTAEVLLADPAHLNRRIDENFKHVLYSRFGLQSDRFEAVDDYQLYVRIAEPVMEAVRALLGRSQGPHYVLAHEYMGVPAALKARTMGPPGFTTVFYAHEVSTVRPVVESSPGHDTMFYNVMRRCLSDGIHFADVFGDPSDFYRHALISQARHCDAVFAVGRLVRDELLFLDAGFGEVPVYVVHNGLENRPVSPAQREQSRHRMLDYAESLLGYRPDYIFTHVARPVVSKGIWRDLRVLENLDLHLQARGRSAVFFLLTSAAGVRESSDVLRMEADYGWPVGHRKGVPDLVGNELVIWSDVTAFNASSRAVQAVLVNQFGWDSAHCGNRMSPDMAFDDLRTGCDLEFGQSIYEPFGIAQLEPLGAGALCLISSVCGCAGVLDEPGVPASLPNLVVADYVTLENGMSWDTDPGEWSLDALRGVGWYERERIEQERSRGVADRLAGLLSQTQATQDALLESGAAAAHAIGWEQVCQGHFLPCLKSASR